MATDWTADLDPDLKEFIELLNSEGVRYLLLGGYAVNYHGHDRYTGDIDFWIDTDLENARRVSSALQKFGFSPDSVKPEQFTQVGKIHMFGRVPRRVDLLTSPAGVSFEDCYRRKIDIKWHGMDVPLISLDDLLANKTASNRDKDQLDVKELRRRNKRNTP